MKTMRPPAPKASDNYVEIPPNAARTLAALRELGYDSVSAVCDLIDNSIDAGARQIWVNVRQIGKSHLIEVIDTGKGMDKERLREALRLGSETPHESDDLGKYGMGLTTASLSIAKTIFVLTREKGEQGYEATFDVTTVERENKWVLDLRAAKTEMLDNEIGDYGTMVRLSNIDRLDDTNPNRFAATLREEIGRIFRAYLKDGLTIIVNRKKVDAVDPLMRDRDAVQLLDQDIDLGHGAKARLTIVELPDLGPAEDEAAGIVPQRSGFYVVRNRREIMAAQTFDFYKHHHSYSHFRAELSFGRELDGLFHVDVKKTAVHPNDQVLEKIRHVARRFIEASGRVGRERAIEKTQLNHSLTMSLLGGMKPPQPVLGKAPTPTPPIRFNESDHGSPDVLFKIEHHNGDVTLNYNKRHPLVRMIADARLQKGIAILDCVCLALAQIAQEDKAGQAVVDRINKTLLNILTAGTDMDTWEARDRRAK